MMDDLLATRADRDKRDRHGLAGLFCLWDLFLNLFRRFL